MDSNLFFIANNLMKDSIKHFSFLAVQTCRNDKSKTYWCHSHFVDEEVGQTGSLADESLLTEGEAVGIFRLLTRLHLRHQLSLQ